MNIDFQDTGSINRDMCRKIIHLDMDAFYAAVEQRDNPELRGKPVIVGGSAEGRGVVSTASYEARKFGIHSAMPAATAVRLCPQAAFLPVDMKKYVAVSEQIMNIFREYTPHVEPLSLDEAFLDVTGSEMLFGDVTEIARTIKRRIQDELHLTASAGVAPNKFLAKVASDLNKPDGLVIVHPDNIQEFLWPLPVACIWGVGKVSQKKLHSMGIFTIGDLAELSVDEMEKKFGKVGPHLYNLARGIDERPVESRESAKSMGHEETYPSNIGEPEQLRLHLLSICERVGRRLRRHGLKGYTVNLKARYPDFQTVTRSLTLSEPTNDTLLIFQTATGLLEKTEAHRKKVRLLGVSLSHFAEKHLEQLTIFEQNRQKRSDMTRAFDRIRDRFGEDTIKRASLLNLKTVKKHPRQQGYSQETRTGKKPPQE